MSFKRRSLGCSEPAIPVEVLTEVWETAKGLPARQREAIVLRHLRGMSEPEVAGAPGVAVGTASATLSAARSWLARLLTDPVTPDHNPLGVE